MDLFILLVNDRHFVLLIIALICIDIVIAEMLGEITISTRKNRAIYKIAQFLTDKLYRVFSLVFVMDALIVYFYLHYTYGI